MIIDNAKSNVEKRVVSSMWKLHFIKLVNSVSTFSWPKIMFHVSTYNKGNETPQVNILWYILLHTLTYKVA